MSDHRVTVTTIDVRSGMRVRCSCGEELIRDNLFELDELNQLAHEHIEAADRAPLIR